MPSEMDSAINALVKALHESASTGSSVKKEKAKSGWEQPPPGKDGKPLTVSVRFATFKIDQISTKTLSAEIKVAVLFFWNDERLIDWEGPLPQTLWGPWPFVVNQKRGFTFTQTQFELADPKTGRMKRGVMMQGPIENGMDLHEFPFDADAITLVIESVSHWKSMDGKMQGSLPTGQSYTLVESKPEDKEGPLLAVYWSGQINEWELVGGSVKVEQMKPTPQGSIRTKMDVEWHIARKSRFYFLKVLLPLYLVAFFCTKSIFEVPPSSLPNRNTLVAQHITATFALLWIVNSMLPTTDYMTRLDKSVICSIGLILSIAIESSVVYQVSTKVDAPMADKIDIIAGFVIATTYVLANLIIFWPGIAKQRKMVSRLKSMTLGPVSEEIAKKATIVTKGSTFFPQAVLLKFVPGYKPPKNRRASMEARV